MAGDTDEPTLKPGEHFDLVVSIRNTMIDRNLGGGDGDMLMRRFGIDVPTDDSGPPWGDLLMNADEGDLIGLAQYLGIPVPITATAASAEPIPSALAIDAYAELVAAETALRDVIRLAISDWQTQLGQEAIEKLDAKRAEEDKKRDGIAVSQDLLDYTEVHQLQKLINTRWDAVKPILDDKKRTEVYLDIVHDVRNTIGHSRPVAPSERLLLAGAAGQIRNQLARYRSSQDGAADYYSSIDSARDSFGTDGFGNISYPMSPDRPGILRLNVGDEITFELTGTDPRGRELRWAMYVASRLPGAYELSHARRQTATGARTSLTWKVSRDDVGENRYVAIALRNSSRFQRHDASYDAGCHFMYHVNPPLDNENDG